MSDGNTQGFEGKAADQQDAQHPPGRVESCRVMNGTGRFRQVGGVITVRDVTTEEPQQHGQGSGDADQVDWHHHCRVLVEADVEVVRRDDIHQVGDHQRQAGGVGDKPCAHHEGQGGGG